MATDGDCREYPPLATKADFALAHAIAESRYPPTLAPWNEQPTVQAVYDRPDGVTDMYALLAPLLVKGGAKAAAGMRLHNREWRAAIDAAIVEWTKELNVALLAAQEARHVLSVDRPPDLSVEQTAVGWAHNGPPTAEQIVERVALQVKHDSAKNDQTALLLRLEHAFGKDAAQALIKAHEMLDTTDPRPKPARISVDVPGTGGQRSALTADKRYHYHVAETTSFYLALAADRCQIHAHAPTPIRKAFQGRCACADEALTLVHLPPIYDTGLVLYGCPACVARMCCKFNIMTNAPLEIDRPPTDLPSTMWDVAPAWHNVPAYENMKLAKALARHVGLGAPFTHARLTSRQTTAHGGTTWAEQRALGALFEKSEVDAGAQTERTGGGPAAGKRRRLAGEVAAGADSDSDSDGAAPAACPVDEEAAANAGKWAMRARSNRCVLLFDHPGIAHRPPLTMRYATLQRMLGFTDYELRLALADVVEERQSEQETRALVRRQHCALLQNQFARLVGSDANSGQMHDYSIATLDALYPGVHKTVEVVMEGVDFCAHEHVLDIGLVRELVRGVGLMTGPLAQHDEFLSATRASGHAYCFVTGMGAGLLPGITPTQIAERLHLDPIENVECGYNWHAIVNALWVFDALWYENVGLRKKGGVTQEGNVGCASAGADFALPNVFEWYVRVGAGDQTIEIVGDWEPPPDRAGWLDIRRQAIDRTSELGWQAAWPSVPDNCAIAETSRSVTSAVSKPKRALNFLEVTAQQLVYWPKTRAQGVEVLTGNNLSGFIEACGKAAINLEGLAALAAMQTPGDEPEGEDDENDQGAEGGSRRRSGGGVK